MDGPTTRLRSEDLPGRQHEALQQVEEEVTMLTIVLAVLAVLTAIYVVVGLIAAVRLCFVLGWGNADIAFWFGLKWPAIVLDAIRDQFGGD